MRTPRHVLALGSCILFTSLILICGCSDRASFLGPEGLSLADPGSAAPARLGSDQEAASQSGSQVGVYRRIWPHEDGRSWTYQVVSREWDTALPAFYPTPDEVPTVTLDGAAALLGSDPVGPNPVTTTGSYGLRFNGLITTLSGVTRQNLEVFDGTAVRQMNAAIGRPEDGFMRLLRIARPDIARQVEGSAVRADRLSSSADVFYPTLLHGYAWEQNKDWIGTYGDLNQQVAWIFLKSDILPGSEFSLQLVPDLANDVFLHARVLGWKRVAREGRTFQRALEVLYLVDFGLSIATDVDGNAIGYYRGYLYGTVSYVPGVGPIHSYERATFPPFDGDLTLSLVSTEPGNRRTLTGR